MAPNQRNQTKPVTTATPAPLAMIDVGDDDLDEIATTSQVHALVPTSIKDAMMFCEWLAESSLLPKSVNKVHDIFFIVCAGAELGLAPMAALRGLYSVNGRTALESKTKAALALEKGKALYFKRTEYTKDATTWETCRKGGTPVQMRYTRQEAIDAYLAPGKQTSGGPEVAGKEGPWRLYTQRMISWRSLGWLCDDVYPDVVMGVATAEDMDDMTPGQVFNALPIAAERKADVVTEPAPKAAPVESASTAPPPEQPTAQPAPLPKEEVKRPPISKEEQEEIIELIHATPDGFALSKLAQAHIHGRTFDPPALREELHKHYESKMSTFPKPGASK